MPNEEISSLSPIEEYLIPSQQVQHNHNPHEPISFSEVPEPRDLSIKGVLGDPKAQAGRFGVFEVPDTEGQTRDVVVWESPQLKHELPDGVFLIGGAARSVIQETLFGEEVGPPRDIDIVGITDFLENPYDENVLEGVYRDLGDEYDRESGNIENLNHYLNSRDLTINEVLVGSKYCMATAEAIRDLRDKVIRPTKSEAQKWWHKTKAQKGVSPKIVMKAVRLKEEFEEMYGQGKIEDVPNWQFEVENIPPFHIALHLDKAIQSGDAAAERFFMALLKSGIIGFNQGELDNENPLRANNPYEFARKLRLSLFQKAGSREPFVFSKEEFNITSKEDLERHKVQGEEPVIGNEDYYKAAQKAEEYVGQKNLSGIGFDEWRGKQRVSTIVPPPQNEATEESSGISLVDSSYEPEPLSAIEQAMYDSFNGGRYANLVHPKRK